MIRVPSQSSVARQHRTRAVRGRSLGLSPGSTVEMARQVQRGFPYRTLAHFQRASGLPISHIAGLVQIPLRTLSRRRVSGRLRSEESQRLLRISAVFDKALDLFEGDAQAARHWLETPRRELGDESPLEFARTEIGAREVEDMIGRLEHGVFM